MAQLRTTDCRLRSADRDLLSLCARCLTTLMIGLCCTALGCQTMGNSGDASWMEKMTSTASIRGPLERSFSDETPLEAGQRFSEEAQQMVLAAQERFDQKDYAGAKKIYKSVAKKFKESSVGEQAQFGLAECLYAMGDLPDAKDAYDQLFVDYPSTRYVEPATRRLFSIARRWMEISDPVAKSEIRQVSQQGEVDPSADSEAATDDWSLRYRLLPNLRDKSRPVFDTQGRALQALKAIWLNDPTGPLADDALMLTATYYQRRRNFIEADRYYKILREEYPNSPHFEKAFVLGSHVKLMSYQGTYYEGGDLDSAARLKEQSLQLFPVSEQRGAVREDLQKIYLLQAERAWGRVEYYQKKRRPRAVAIACMSLISEFPDTKFAADAKRILSSIDRSELQGLPEIEEYLQSIPNTQSRPNGSETPGDNLIPKARAKTVSDSRAEDPQAGRVRI